MNQLPDETRVTGRLPNLDIEVTHRREADAEHVTISLRATPSIEAFGRFLELNPLLPFLAINPFFAAIQKFWAPLLSGSTEGAEGKRIER
jgi:hypothetical protein